MARHSVEDTGHWNSRIDQLVRGGMTRPAATQQARAEAEALINQVRGAGNVQRYRASDGQTIFLRRGDDVIVLENPARQEGTVFRRASPQAAKDYFDRFKMDNPGGI